MKLSKNIWEHLIDDPHISALPFKTFSTTLCTEDHCIKFSKDKSILTFTGFRMNYSWVNKCNQNIANEIIMAVPTVNIHVLSYDVICFRAAKNLTPVCHGLHSLFCGM